MNRAARRDASHRTLMGSFLRMVLLFVPIVLCITITVFLYAERTIEAEFSSINLSDARAAGKSMERLTRKMRFITATLLLDENARMFFTGSEVFAGTEKALNGQIAAYLYTYEGIDSVYLYAPASGRVLNGMTCYESVSALTDRDWLIQVQAPGSMLIQPRVRREGYPYALTAMRRLSDYGYDGVAVVNLSLQSIGAALDIQEDDTHLFYLLDAEGRVLYRRNKQALLEDAARFDDLVHFQADQSDRTLLDRSGDRAYVWSQVYDETSGFYFVKKTYLAEYTERVSMLRAVVFAVAMILLGLFVCVAAYLTVSALRPLRHLERVLDQGETNASERRQDEYTRYLTRRIMAQIQSNTRFRELLTDQLILLEKTQLRSLRSQINPHFLFNTLNAISMQISAGEEGADRAVAMIGWLSELLRYSLAREDAVPLSTELFQTRNYLNLLLARYDQEFTVSLDAQPGLDACLVPRLCLQPLIENAVFHGVTPLEERQGVIGIDIRREEDELLIRVRDNGAGMSPENLERLRGQLNHLPSELPERHIGLLNVAMRLHLMYPAAPPVQADSVLGEYTCFTLRIPLGGR